MIVFGWRTWINSSQEAVPEQYCIWVRVSRMANLNECFWRWGWCRTYVLENSNYTSISLSLFDEVLNKQKTCRVRSVCVLPCVSGGGPVVQWSGQPFSLFNINSRDVSSQLSAKQIQQKHQECGALSLSLSYSSRNQESEIAVRYFHLLWCELYK